MGRLALEGGPKTIDSPLPTIRNASGRTIGDEELKRVQRVLESGNLAYIYGQTVSEFESSFARLTGVDHAVAVSSGTAALHTALVYLNPDPGDEIIVSPITDMGSVIPILYQQAVPVFVDVDDFNQNLDPNLLESAISERTRAIMVTHIFGSPADMDPIMEIARRHNLVVIEDCAQAHLTEYRGKIVGTIGDLGCFSFQQSKHITTGDGGMVIAREDNRFERPLRLCFDKGWPREKPGRDHRFLAPNYHMTELQAAVGLAQMGKYSSVISARRDAAEELDRRLSGETGITPVGTLPGCKQTYFYYCFRLDLSRFRVDGCRFVSALRAEGLECELGYPGPIPLYLYPMIRDKKTFGSSGWPFTSPAARQQWEYPAGLCPVAEQACRETVVLPWNERLERHHIALVAEAILKVCKAYREGCA
ncbi:MAG: DegT/DnrJ/EryC1/StrS family aminotransferase [Acidobacteria bacterium]|nr:DegT/DnrJ/EryC1/StrS family aminotransferase [Acidobacteriota bacterium]